jgi:1-phosphofructokinase family hexose kinase
MNRHFSHIVSITFNPAIDQTLSIPGFTKGSVNRVEKSEENPGGKGINVAAFARDYGIKVKVSGFLGRDNSKLFTDFFINREIEDHFIHVNGLTRKGIKIIDGQTTTDINFPGFRVTPEQIKEFIEKIEKLISHDALFTISGSLPPGVESSLYGKTVKLIKEKGGIVCIDTWGKGFISGINEAPHVIKPNIFELEGYCGKRIQSFKEAINESLVILNRGVKKIVLSLGSDGALFIDHHRVIHTEAHGANVISTVGAGDAMLAGVAVSMVERKNPEESALLATAFSSIAVSQIAPGIPSPELIHSIIPEISITSAAPDDEVWKRRLMNKE